MFNTPLPVLDPAGGRVFVSKMPVSAARHELVNWNLECLTLTQLKNGMDVIREVIRPALDAQILKGIAFCGFNKENLCCGVLSIKIDWVIHNRERAASARVEIDGRWVEQVSPQLRLVSERFARIVKTQGLRVRATISLPRRAQGMVGGKRIPRASPLQWAGPLIGHDFRVDRLEELGVQYVLADVEN